MENLAPALVRAIQKKDVEKARELLAAGADPNALDENGSRVLHHATDQGEAGVVELLLKAGADPSAVSRDLRTPLSIAATYCRPDLTGLLLRHGAQPNEPALAQSQSALHRAALYGCQAHVGKKRSPSREERERCLEVMELLLKAGADIAARDSNQDTPLHTAIAAAPPRAVELLLKAGADPNASDKDHRPPTFLALNMGAPKERLPKLELLLEAGADPNARHQETPLLLRLFTVSSAADAKRLIPRMVERGTDVDAPDANGWTVLHHATQQMLNPLVQLLLKLGANPEARSTQPCQVYPAGSTPLSIAERLAEQCRATSLLKLLRTHVAKASGQEPGVETLPGFDGETRVFLVAGRWFEGEHPPERMREAARVAQRWARELRSKDVVAIPSDGRVVAGLAVRSASANANKPVGPIRFEQLQSARARCDTLLPEAFWRELSEALGSPCEGPVRLSLLCCGPLASGWLVYGALAGQSKPCSLTKYFGTTMRQDTHVTGVCGVKVAHVSYEGPDSARLELDADVHQRLVEAARGAGDEAGYYLIARYD
jgi:ankyrin repeat protein